MVILYIRIRGCFLFEKRLTIPPYGHVFALRRESTWIHSWIIVDGISRTKFSPRISRDIFVPYARSKFHYYNGERAKHPSSGMTTDRRLGSICECVRAVKPLRCTCVSWGGFLLPSFPNFNQLPRPFGQYCQYNRFRPNSVRITHSFRSLRVEKRSFRSK